MPSDPHGSGVHLTKSLSVKASAWWRSDGFVGLVALAATVALQFSTDFVAGLERRFYDVASTVTTRQPSSRIALIAMDDKSIAALGQLPWTRDVHARLIDLLAAAKAHTVVDTADFFEPQAATSLAYFRKIKEVLDSSGEAGGEASQSNAQIRSLVSQAQSALDTDAALAASLQAAGNVLLPSLFTLGEVQAKSAPPLPGFAQKSAMDALGTFSVPAVQTRQPIALLGDAAAGVGHLTAPADADGAVRAVPLLVNFSGKAVPSLALLAALHSLNLQVSDIKLPGDGSVHIGKLRIPTDDHAVMLPQFYRDWGGKPAFAADSFSDVLTGNISSDKYAGKIVIIGATATGAGVASPVPGLAALSPAQSLAHVTSSILSGHSIVLPEWGVWAAFGVFLLIAAYVVVALPLLSAGMAAGVSLLLVTLLLATEFGLLSLAGVWIKLIFPVMALLVGHLACSIKRLGATQVEAANTDGELAETHRLMGLALQGQGQLDMAFERLRRVPMGDALMGHLYSLALDFERKHQTSKADAVYSYMAGFDAGYKDIGSRLNRTRNLPLAVTPSSAVLAVEDGLPSDVGTPRLRMLGRYEVEKELGKGAMGVVYLGRDPKIGRVVAIKTLALSQEFVGEDLVDARKRFFREAETAGRLQHQNIVTIFDAGEEQDLAFIAMEFLKGRDLSECCKPGQLLPVDTVLGVVARVAEALGYAHSQNVVHRDIKPANVMYDAATDSVKVTDFGIARITDSSKTKTGWVMGTPSFMSPEQLAGKKVDGRSDLYSLGVMLYQLLCGVLPFRGDSMSELMYKIANQEASDIRSVRPELSAELASAVALALNKRPEMRYQTGEQIAADLRALVAHPADLPGSARVIGTMDIEI